MKSYIQERFWLLWLFISLVLAALLALGVGLTRNGLDQRGWMAALMLLWPAVYLLGLAWNWAGKGKLLAGIIITAFLLRFGLGVFFFHMLPVWGYENPAQQAGYLFADSYTRDNESWDLAVSSQPLMTAFQGEYSTDQYGGLMFISSAIYRSLSPDAHRPLLIVILTAFAGALAIPFLWKAVHLRWGRWVAAVSCWVLALYPETIFLGSSQMREPFLIASFCIAFEQLLTRQTRTKLLKGIIFLVSLLIMILISWRVGLVAAGGLGIYYALDRWSKRWSARSQTLLWFGLGLAMIALAAMSWIWFRDSARWDAILLLQNSGMAQYYIDFFGEEYRLLLVTLYGLLQPFLPASIVELSIPLASAVVIVRALGWWLLAPLFIYACVAVWKVQPAGEKQVWVWMAGFCLIWILASSLRAGGDLWDNPRYRSIFLPWIALLAAWSWHSAREKKDPWLRRLFILEGIAALMILIWYIGRHLPFGHFPLPVLVLGSGGILAVLFGYFFFRDYIKKKHGQSHPNQPN